MSHTCVTTCNSRFLIALSLKRAKMFRYLKMSVKRQTMMPGEGMTDLGLATPAMNTAAMVRHPIQKCTKTMVEQETLSNFELARKHQVKK